MSKRYNFAEIVVNYPIICAGEEVLYALMTDEIRDKIIHDMGRATRAWRYGALRHNSNIIDNYTYQQNVKVDRLLGLTA